MGWEWDILWLLCWPGLGILFCAGDKEFYGLGLRAFSFCCCLLLFCLLSLSSFFSLSLFSST